MKRRTFLLGGGALIAAGGALALVENGVNAKIDLGSRTKLQMPPLLDTTSTGRLNLTAQYGQTSFFKNSVSKTIGFNQDYLGPTIRMQNGPLATNVLNALRTPVTVHWHGLLVPGVHDGGPHLPIASGDRWTPDMQINQNPTTAFYHTHIHGRTAQDVYAGLAGVIHLSDDLDDDRAIPNTYGLDDLTLVLQDRRFNGDGRLVYDLTMMDAMHGFTANTILVNGKANAVASVPKGIVRLRLINGSNARIFSLFANDNRNFQLIATDGGFLDQPSEIRSLRLAPGERAELLLDFGDGQSMTLMSDGDPNVGPSGMMGRVRGLVDSMVDRSFVVLPFVVDSRLTSRFNKFPDRLGGSVPDLSGSEIRVRQFSLDMSVGSGRSSGRGMMGGGMMMGEMGINNQSFDMTRIDLGVGLRSIEKWVVSTTMLAHPFHIHGAVFQVLRENGHAPRPENVGWKDTVTIDGVTELLARFDTPATPDHPYMYHCHILEHEDRGMMGQFTVS